MRSLVSGKRRKLNSPTLQSGDFRELVPRSADHSSGGFDPVISSEKPHIAV